MGVAFVGVAFFPLEGVVGLEDVASFVGVTTFEGLATLVGVATLEEASGIHSQKHKTNH